MDRWRGVDHLVKRNKGEDDMTSKNDAYTEGYMQAKQDILNLLVQHMMKIENDFECGPDCNRLQIIIAKASARIALDTTRGLIAAAMNIDQNHPQLDYLIDKTRKEILEK
jgi:hypothetical protein